MAVGSAERTVKYRFYRNNVYARHPVSYTYQSLIVSVPVEINGKALDATHAPVLFAINVGGCTSSSSWDATAQGGGMSSGTTAGGFGTGGQASASPTGASDPPGGSAGGPAGGTPTGRRQRPKRRCP